MNKELFRNNCFTLIRYILAFEVMISHMNMFLGTNYFSAFDKITTVPLFFFISAFLLSYSLDNKKQSFKEYISGRIKRLYPELWIAVILCIVLLIIQFPNLLKETMFYFWIFGQATVLQFYTPNILRFYGVGTPNGSLWTISVFLQFYIAIYYLFPKIKKLSFKQDLLVIAFGVAVNSLLFYTESFLPEIGYRLLWQTLLPYLYMFYFGVLFYKYFDKVVVAANKYYWILLFAYIFEYVNSSFFNIIPHTSNTSAPIHVMISCLFWFATAYKFKNIKIKNDYSYGIYVFNMVIVNYFVHNQPIQNKTITFVSIIVITLISSITSNKIVKKIIS